MLTRRQVLGTAAAASVLSGLRLSGLLGVGPRARAQAASRPSFAPPRYFVTVFLRGGIDAVYTTDPKTRSEVDADVDVPYGANDIVDAGKMQFGPHFRPLARWAPELAVVRGVQVTTANHETGAFQMMRLRTNVEPTMPSLQDIIGAHRDTQPLASVTVGRLNSFEASPNAVVAPNGTEGRSLTSLEAVDALSDEEAALLSTAFENHLRHFSKEAGGRDAVTRDHLTQAQSFFKRLQRVPRFKAVDWRNGPAGGGTEALQRTLWFLQNDLAKGIVCKIQSDWDSHYRNADRQARATAAFTQVFSRFLDELHARRNEYGTLAEQTVVVCGSELGRFPVINGDLGKDHFPKSQFLLFGRDINGGSAFGTTGRRMEGQPIDLQTGRDRRGGEHVYLDDLGATVLTMAGLKPELYGYTGRSLPFLMRSRA
jgi:hypothetical protein